MDLLIFDLDGTLIDSKLDLAHAVNATRSHLGYSALKHDTVYSYVGNGAPTLIRRALGAGATDAQVEQGLAYFLNYYREHMVDYTVLYPGVRESLARIAAAGVKMAVLTNKPVRISVAILDALGVGGYFRQVYGGNSFEQKKPHPVGIETLLAECRAQRLRTMMVGDSAVDIETARNARVKSCGVTYGFQPVTLVVAQPDLLVDRIEELADWVIANG